MGVNFEVQPVAGDVVEMVVKVHEVLVGLLPEEVGSNGQAIFREQGTERNQQSNLQWLCLRNEGTA